ncbi:hypothetical protein C8F01DRAFT_1091830 [Mycena amicta]|nr:hypothetical protein C8F01DRAFT_1091830 [Mycena amicta]
MSAAKPWMRAWRCRGTLAWPPTMVLRLSKLLSEQFLQKDNSDTRPDGRIEADAISDISFRPLGWTDRTLQALVRALNLIYGFEHTDVPVLLMWSRMKSIM